MWISPRHLINCGMTACFTNYTEWTVHKSLWSALSNTWSTESVTSKLKKTCFESIFFLLFYCEMAHRITSAIYSHLFADDLALIIHASPWWPRTEFATQMERIGQQALNQVQAYAVEWKQAINFPKTEWQWINRRVVIPTLSLSISQHPIERTAVYKYLGYHVDERLSFNAHCTRMLQKAQKNSGIFKYVTRWKTSSTRARTLISQAFIHPYLQMIYVVWPMLSISSIEKIEAKNRQLSRLTHNWWDATNDEVRWLPNYETTESKAQRFLRRFLDKAATISSELFENYILSKAMPMYLRMHIDEQPLINAFPRGRFNKYIHEWMNSSIDEKRKCYLDRLSNLLNEEHWECTEKRTWKRLEIGTYCRLSYNHEFWSNKALTHIHATPVAAPDTKVVPDLISVCARMNIWGLSEVANALCGAACCSEKLCCWYLCQLSRKTSLQLFSFMHQALELVSAVHCQERDEINNHQKDNKDWQSRKFFLLFTPISSSRIGNEFIHISDLTFYWRWFI